MISYGCMIGPPAAEGKGIQIIGDGGGFIFNELCDSIDGWVISGQGSIAANGTFYASNYGTGADWHGPTATRSFAQISQDFELNAVLSLSAALSVLGRIQINIRDASDNIICELYYSDDWANSEGTRYTRSFCVLGEVINSNNALYGGLSSCPIKIKRVGGSYYFYENSVLIAIAVKSIVAINKVSISFQKYSTYSACAMNMESCSLKVI